MSRLLTLRLVLSHDSRIVDRAMQRRIQLRHHAWVGRRDVVHLPLVHGEVEELRWEDGAVVAPGVPAVVSAIRSAYRQYNNRAAEGPPECG